MNVITAANGIIHEILPKSALTEALDLVAGAIAGEVTEEMALQHFLLFLKDRTGIQAPELFELLQGLKDDPATVVRNALQDWDKSQAKLQAAIDGLVALQGKQAWLFKSDEAGGLEFLTLAHITGQSPVSLDIQYGKETILKKGSFQFGISGEAKTALSVQVLDADKAEDDLAIELSPDSNRIVVYSLSGDLGVEGKGGNSVAGGSFGISAGAKAGTRLRYIFQHPSDTKSIRAITSAYENMLNPFDLDAIANKLAAPGTVGLRQLRFDGARSGWLDLDFNLSRTVSAPTLVKMPKGKKTLQLNQALSASIQVRYRAEASRMIVVNRDKDEDGVIQLVSKHQRMKRNQFGLSLMAGIELVGLGGVAKSWAEHLLPEVGELKELLEEYAKPGDILMGKLDSELKGADDWVQSLGELLLGETDADSAAKELTGDINAKVADLLDGAVNIFDFGRGKSSELAGQLTSKLTENNDLLGIYKQDIAKWLQSSLTGKLTEFLDEFEGKVISKADELAAKVTETSTKAVSKQLVPLEDFGLKVSDVIDELNQHGASLVDPVIGLLKQYGAQRKKLIEAVAKSVQAKLAFALKISRTVEERGAGEEVYKLVLPPGGVYSNRARSDYRKWLVGRLPASSDFGGFGELIDGSISYGVTGTTTTNVTLDLGPMTFGYNSIIKESVDFKVALDGTILVGEARFEGREWTLKLGSRSAESRFAGMMPVIDDEGNVTGEPFSLGHSYRNKKCDVKELGNYLESTRAYEQNGLFGLLPLRRKSLLADAFAERDTRLARIDISMVVSAQSLSELITNGLDRELLASLLWNAYAAKYSDLMDLFYGLYYRSTGHEADLVLQLVDEYPGDIEANWDRKIEDEVIGRSLESIRDSTEEAVGEAFKLVQAFHGIEMFFEKLQEYAKWREDLTAPVDADRDTLEQWIKEVTKTAFKIAKKAAKGLSKAADAAGQAVASDEVPPDTLALFAYFDGTLDDDQVLAALNLETAPRDAKTSWQLVVV